MCETLGLTDDFPVPVGPIILNSEKVSKRCCEKKPVKLTLSWDPGAVLWGKA